MDSLLAPYLAASGDETEKLLETLLVHEAGPRIHEIVLRKLGPDCPDIDDVCGEVLVQAAEQLRAWKADTEECRVDSFVNYVAVCAFNQASEYLRRKYPQWRRLRDRIHYVLRHDPRLAIWECARGWVCGLARWKGQASIATLPALDECSHARGRAASDSLHAVLAIAGGPIELDALVGLAANLWGEPLDRETTERPEPSIVPQFEDEIDQRRYAVQLWSEILELPLRQRQALLLNVKTDGLDVFVLFGVASFRNLAEALAITAEQFAALWKLLPQDDLTIAARLECTRQQVINLRKSARKRLANRMLANKTRANKEAHLASLQKGEYGAPE